MNKLTKEECLKALDILKEEQKYLSSNFRYNYPYTLEMLELVQSCFEQLINEHFELKEIIKKHGLENLTLHELDCAFKKMLGYVQENNRLMNLLTQQNEIIKEYQNGEAYKELKRSYDELLGHAVAFQEELINLKDNPPLKFEELKPGMWVWDRELSAYIQIYAIYDTVKGIRVSSFGTFEFEENRYFRYEVKEVKMMKTAKEMFEELGYVYTNDDGFTDYIKKEYDEDVKEWDFKEVSFDRWSRRLSVYSFIKNDDCTDFIHKGTNMKIVFLDEFELKAIHQQCKELGWLDAD